MVELKTNVLYYGDNLEILRKHIPDESIDLIYLDPPFNSNRSYNVLFRESTGAASDAQIEAFEDTWNWAGATATYDELIRGPHQQVSRILKAMVDGLGHNEVTAYLCMMAIRLVELHRALKPTGSLYLHCDPTASHYLKVLMDAVFGASNFLNEIVWCYDTGGRPTGSFPRKHDIILRYGLTKDTAFYYDNVALPRDPSTMHEVVLTDEHGRMYQRNIKGGREYRYYLDKGVLPNDWWSDIQALNPAAKERLGYPTQKPLALLERIIQASSNEGEVVLDPFCGCGTAVHAAHKLGRRWIGIDITYLAINLIERRMTDAFPDVTVEVEGAPKDLASAHDLAHRDKWQFQWWALARLDAQPVAGKKRGKDKGIDGVIPIVLGGTADKPEYGRAIISIKGGEHVGVAMVRELLAVLQREAEPIGVLVTLVRPTRDMVGEAAAAGFYHSEFYQRDYRRLQLITIQDVLEGKRLDLPPSRLPFGKASVEKKRGKQAELPRGAAGGFPKAQKIARKEAKQGEML